MASVASTAEPVRMGVIRTWVTDSGPVPFVWVWPGDLLTSRLIGVMLLTIAVGAATSQTFEAGIATEQKIFAELDPEEAAAMRADLGLPRPRPLTRAPRSGAREGRPKVFWPPALTIAWASLC